MPDYVWLGNNINLSFLLLCWCYSWVVLVCGASLLLMDSMVVNCRHFLKTERERVAC